MPFDSLKYLPSHYTAANPSNVEVRGADCYTKGPGLESRVSHTCQIVRTWPHQWLRSIIGRREVPGSFLGPACRPSRSEFSVVFSETRVNMGKDPIERPPTEGTKPISLCPRETIGLKNLQQ